MLTLLPLALASCQRVSKPAGAPPGPGSSQALAAPPPAGPGAPTRPTSAPTRREDETGPSLTQLSPLTPKLEGVVGELRRRQGGAPFDLRQELGRHLSGFSSGEGKGLPAAASVEVFEVRQRSLVMAFVRVTPSGYRPTQGSDASEEGCPDPRTSPTVHALFIRKDAAGKESLAFSTDAFDACEARFFGGRPELVIPRLAASVGAFEIHYEADEGGMEAVSGEMVEVYHLGSMKRVDRRTQVDVATSVPGKDTSTRSAMSWVAGRSSGEASLVITELTTHEEIPCTGTGSDVDEKSAECRHRFQCSLATRVHAVDRQEWREAAAELAQLKRTRPALARVPADREGETEKACRRLEAQLRAGRDGSLCGAEHPSWKQPRTKPAARAASQPARVVAPGAAAAPATPRALPAGCPALELAPVSAARQAEARRLNGLGVKRHRAADFKGAIEQLTQALRANPGHLLARYNLACAHNRDGQPATALALLAELRRCSAAEGGAACAKVLRSARTDPDLESLRSSLPE